MADKLAYHVKIRGEALTSSPRPVALRRWRRGALIADKQRVYRRLRCRILLFWRSNIIAQWPSRSQY